MKKVVIISSILIVLATCFILCERNSKIELVLLLEKWIGREIIFSETKQINVVSGDTVELSCFNGFVVVHYVDSAGCTSCNLKLGLWKSFISDINKVSKEPVSLVFVLNTENSNFRNLFGSDSSLNVINIYREPMCQLNDLFDNKYFNTILLDNNNKIVTVGNPILTPKIKSNYYRAVIK